MDIPKLGLNLGEKLRIADKEYRILNDGIKDIREPFGKLTFISYNGQDLIAEDGVLTGESRGLVLSVSSQALKEALTITLTEMTETELAEVNLSFGDKIDFDDIVVTYSQVNNNQIKLYASRVKKVEKPKVGQTPNQSQSKSQEQDKK